MIKQATGEGMTTCQHERPTHKRRYFDVCEEDEKIFFKYEGAWRDIDFARWYEPQDTRLLWKAVIEQIPRHKRVMKLDGGTLVVYYQNELHNKDGRSLSELGAAIHRITKHVKPGWYYLETEKENNV